MSDKEHPGFDFGHGIRLFRDESNDAVDQLEDDFSEGELEFLEEAKLHYDSILKSVDNVWNNKEVIVTKVGVTIEAGGFEIGYILDKRKFTGLLAFEEDYTTPYVNGETNGQDHG